MKTCPNCGSILADFEPYCNYCGFDPDYDMGDWDYGQISSSIRPYTHKKHIKSSSKDSQDDGAGIIVGVMFLGVLIFGVWAYLDMYSWDIGYLIYSNVESIVLLIIVVTVVGLACYYFNKL